MARRYVTTYYKCRQEPTQFKDVKTFCMFIGHVKSGSTLIGSLLDAHPNVILADEADALKYVSSGFSRDQLFHILLKASHREALKGRVTARRLNAYSLSVPDQWQGRYNKLQVIGDSKAGPSTRIISRDPQLIQRLNTVMSGIDVKLIQVIRNPYDPISLMMIRGRRSFENAVKHYFAYCETLADIRAKMNESSLLPVRYEEFIRQPEENFLKVCDFLGIEATAEYVSACLGILYSSPEQSRHLVPWSPQWIEVVKHKIDQFDFLGGYSYEN
ncbi:MAG: sulfotransferase [Anaerolineae bacterium]|nr:sulfotransferase [Anaerolineae bacterium]